MNSLFDIIKKHKKLYILKFSEDHYVVFHIIKLEHFKLFRSVLSTFPKTLDSFLDYIFSECVVEYLSPSLKFEIGDDVGYLTDMVPAGVVDTVARVILRLSGSSSVDELFEDLNESRYRTQFDIEKNIASTVATLWKIHPDRFSKMYYSDYLDLVSISENLLTDKIPEIPFHSNKNNLSDEIDFASEDRNIVD